MRLCNISGCTRSLRADNENGFCGPCARGGAWKRLKRATDAEWAKAEKGWQLAYDEKRSSDPDHVTRKRRNARKYKTGMSHALVLALRETQDGRCAICAVQLLYHKGFRESECADHTEPSGVKVPRGLLCSLCNVGLGMYESGQRAAGLVIEPYERYLSNTPVMQLAQVK